MHQVKKIDHLSYICNQSFIQISSISTLNLIVFYVSQISISQKLHKQKCFHTTCLSDQFCHQTIQFIDNTPFYPVSYILLHIYAEQTTLHITPPLQTKNVKLETLYLPCENMSAQSIMPKPPLVMAFFLFYKKWSKTKMP